MSDFVELKKGNKDSNRRWFMSTDLDLIVFLDEQGEIREFQFCYDKNNNEQILSWNIDSGYSHMGIDDGDDLGEPGYKRTPLLKSNGSYHINEVLEKLLVSSSELPGDVLEFVKTKITNHPDYAFGSEGK